MFRRPQPLCLLVGARGGKNLRCNIGAIASPVSMSDGSMVTGCCDGALTLVQKAATAPDGAGEIRASLTGFLSFSKNRRQDVKQKQMMELWVRQEFDAAHSLKGTFPLGHQCSRMHGHRYTVTLTVRSNSTSDVLVDYHDMHAGLRDILMRYDHRSLNDVMKKATTCENLAREIMVHAQKLWASVSCVEVQEQSNTGCRVLRDHK